MSFVIKIVGGGIATCRAASAWWLRNCGRSSTLLLWSRGHVNLTG